MAEVCTPLKCQTVREAGKKKKEKEKKRWEEGEERRHPGDVEEGKLPVISSRSARDTEQGV